MKIKIKPLIIAVILFFIIIPAVYAVSSSDFLTKAQKYIDNNCSRRSLSNEVSLSCFLFYKVGELDAKVNSNSARISALENVPSPTPSATPSAQKELKMFDSNNIELGIDRSYGNIYVFFYPPLQRFVRVDNNGLLGYFDGQTISYTLTDCTGDAYVTVGDNDMSEKGNRVINSRDGKFYIIEEGTLNTAFFYQSKRDTGSGICTNQFNSSSQRLLKEVSFPLPDPVLMPLHFKYE